MELGQPQRLDLSDRKRFRQIEYFSQRPLYRLYSEYLRLRLSEGAWEGQQYFFLSRILGDQLVDQYPDILERLSNIQSLFILPAFGPQEAELLPDTLNQINEQFSNDSTVGIFVFINTPHNQTDITTGVLNPNCTTFNSGNLFVISHTRDKGQEIFSDILKVREIATDTMLYLYSQVDSKTPLQFDPMILSIDADIIRRPDGSSGLPSDYIDRLRSSLDNPNVIGSGYRVTCIYGNDLLAVIKTLQVAIDLKNLELFDDPDSIPNLPNINESNMAFLASKFLQAGGYSGPTNTTTTEPVIGEGKTLLKNIAALDDIEDPLVDYEYREQILISNRRFLNYYAKRNNSVLSLSDEEDVFAINHPWVSWIKKRYGAEDRIPPREEPIYELTEYITYKIIEQLGELLIIQIRNRYPLKVTSETTLLDGYSNTTNRPRQIEISTYQDLIYFTIRELCTATIYEMTDLLRYTPIRFLYFDNDDELDTFTHAISSIIFENFDDIAELTTNPYYKTLFKEIFTSQPMHIFGDSNHIVRLRALQNIVINLVRNSPKLFFQPSLVTVIDTP
jgi:hypothetical protein